MRELLAKWAAGLTGLAVCAMALVFALIQNAGPGEKRVRTTLQVNFPAWDGTTSPRRMQEQIDLEMGRILFQTLRCPNCHPVSGIGNRRPSLNGIGGRLTGEEMRTWIVAPGEMDPDVVKPDYSYLSRGQVDLLVGYLKSLE